MPTIDELLALDALTLAEHTERAGDRFDTAQHRQRLEASLKISKICGVRRNGELVAYAMLNPLSGGSWFVRGFGTHPRHRTAPVFVDLLRQIAQLARAEGIRDFTSHVYKTNLLSMRFHRRLGFRVTKENDKGVEFYATVDDLAAARSLSFLLGRRPLTPPVA